jgi:hypothetical protein
MILTTKYILLSIFFGVVKDFPILSKSDVIRINVEKETGLLYINTQTTDRISKISLFSIFHSEHNFLSPEPSNITNIFLLSLANFRLSLESDRSNMVQNIQNSSNFDSIINVYQKKDFLVCLNENGGFLRFVEKIPYNNKNLMVFPLNEMNSGYYLKGKILKFGSHDLIIDPKVFIDSFIRGVIISNYLYEILLKRLNENGEIFLHHSRCLKNESKFNYTNVFFEIYLEEETKLDINDIWEKDNNNFTCLKIENSTNIQNNHLIISKNFLKNKLVYFNITSPSMFILPNFDCKLMNIPKINEDIKLTNIYSENSSVGLIVSLLITSLFLIAVFVYAIVKNKRINTDVIPIQKNDIRTEMSEWEVAKKNSNSRRESQEGLILGTLVSPFSEISEKNEDNS